jgi:hypothetical protein
MAVAAVAQAIKKNTFPLILCSSALPAIVMGGTAQPTALGFLVLGCGMALAACNPTRGDLLRRTTAPFAASTPQYA